MLDSPSWRTENRDFSTQTMKPSHGFRIVTKVFLGHFESFKVTFAVSKVPKRFFLAQCLESTIFFVKSDSLEGLGHSPPRWTENRDFSVQKIKSKYVLGH